MMSGVTSYMVNDKITAIKASGDPGVAVPWMGTMKEMAAHAGEATI